MLKPVEIMKKKYFKIKIPYEPAIISKIYDFINF